jgi:hypothetical protein
MTQHRKHTHHKVNTNAIRHEAQAALRYTARSVVKPVYNDVVKPLARVPGELIKAEGEAVRGLSNPIVWLVGGMAVLFIVSRR